MKHLILLLLPLYVFAQRRIPAEEILSMIDREEEVVIQNATIEGTLDFTKLKNLDKIKPKEMRSVVVSKLHFENCTFLGDLIAYKVLDEQNAVAVAYFDEDIEFLECRFEGEVNMKYSVFYEKVNFEKSTFEKEAVFKYARFKREAGFGNVLFQQNAFFKHSDFALDADYYGAEFQETADFKYAQFHKRSTFKNGLFVEFADFKYTQFKEDAVFSKAVFESDSDFKYTKGEVFF